MKTISAIYQITIGFLLISMFVSCAPAHKNVPETELHGQASPTGSPVTREPRPTETLIPTHTATFTPSPTATASPFPTSSLVYTVITRIAEKDGMEMVFVPTGAFEMGRSDGNRHEQPVRQVYLDA